MNVLGVVDGVGVVSPAEYMGPGLEPPKPSLHFTIDGVSLQELFDLPHHLTRLSWGNFDSETRSECLLRLLGAPVAAPAPIFIPPHAP
ncbi:hypothetical protein EH165_04800 [Nakamurella antarctica]|uniref:Uncharacterized protein n=1 Tax=Nakamurella antarctica TaxID=1902245 RepID=A0A3G8ZJQ7_9ACTN|nr:hypothetical protein [Nakamurella antarctica]AZI57579.1 hypothetical protein EH165_04800 [Nakamurella antarctica]